MSIWNDLTPWGIRSGVTRVGDQIAPIHYEIILIKPLRIKEMLCLCFVEVWTFLKSLVRYFEIQMQNLQKWHQQRLFFVLKIVMHVVVVISELLFINIKARCKGY